MVGWTYRQSGNARLFGALSKKINGREGRHFHFPPAYGKKKKKKIFGWPFVVVEGRRRILFGRSKRI
jgi:hypothetical protein